MNLRDAGGRVPLRTGDPNMPYKVVDFPTREEFDTIMKVIPAKTREKYWHILKKRADGATLSEAGSDYKLTRERVRQVEAKFIRLMTELSL